MAESARAHAIISGRVQGVFYRMETQSAAQRIGVKGWVRNLPDGTVEAVFEGEQDQVEAMLGWCRNGPPNARVDDVKVSWQDFADEYGEFRITY